MRKPVNSEIDLIKAIWSRTNLNEGVKADVKVETDLFGDIVKGGKRAKVAEKSGPTRGMGEPEPTPVDLVANSRAAKPSELVHEPLPEVAEMQAAGRSREQAIAATEAPATGMNAMQKMVDDMVNFSGRRGLGKREMNKVWNGTASTASPVANINDIPTPLSTSKQSVNPDYKVTSDVSSVSKPINVPAGLPEVKPIDPNWRNNLLNLGKPQAMLTSDKPTAVNWRSTTINAPSPEPVPQKSLAVVSNPRPNEDSNNNSLVKNLAKLALLSAASYGVTKKITGKETPVAEPVADKTVNTPVVSPVADNDSEYYYPDTFVGRKKQEITEYYRQALVQRLEEEEKKLITGAGARALLPSTGKLSVSKPKKVAAVSAPVVTPVATPVSPNPGDSNRDGAVTPTEMQATATPSVARPATAKDWLSKYMETRIPDAPLKPRENRVLPAGQKPSSTSAAVKFRPGIGDVGSTSDLYAKPEDQASHEHIKGMYQSIALPIMDELDKVENGQADDPTNPARMQSHPTLDILSKKFKLGIPSTYGSLMSVHPGTDEEKAVTQGHITSLLSATPSVLPTTGIPRGTGTNRSRYNPLK